MTSFHPSRQQLRSRGLGGVLQRAWPGEASAKIIVQGPQECQVLGKVLFIGL